MTLSIDWKQLLLGEEQWDFLLEVIFRSIVMFSVALVTLRLIGKRGIMQGVFEIVVIITLGSAAGDPMFYSKVGLLPAILVFIMNIVLYRLVNFIVGRNKTFERIIEGVHAKLISNGEFEIDNFKHEDLAKDEIFSDLRLKNVTHLGQVRSAYVEASGRVSVFYFEDDKVKYGLPVLPELMEQRTKLITKKAVYACSFCGHVATLDIGNDQECGKCRKKYWVLAIDEKRIT